MGRAPQPLPQYTPPGPVEQMPNMGAPQPQCSPLAKIHSNAIFPYQPNEIATSRTEAGHLAPDASMVPPGAPICQYLIIWDFGVDWRHIKGSTKHDPLLALQLNRFETDKSLQFQIVGYSDSAGAERNNVFFAHGQSQKRLSPSGAKCPLARLRGQGGPIPRVFVRQRDRRRQGRKSRRGHRNLLRCDRNNLDFSLGQPAAPRGGAGRSPAPGNTARPHICPPQL